MKFKIKKDLFLKKSTWIVLGLFAVTLVNIPRFKTQATGTKDSLDFTPDTLKILEIAPGDGFSLANGNDSETEANGMIVQVTHMNMAQYISMVDDITGEYDVVALTNQKSGNMSDNYSLGKTFRQYTTPFSQEIGHAKYTNNNGYKDGYSEYYPENDITYKRGKLIVDMINKGQLVYVDSTATTVNGTKLNAIFNGQGTADTGTVINNLNATNLKKVSASEITLQKIVDDYKALPTDNKRVKVAAASKPASENINSDGTVTNERTLNFSVKANAELNENLTFNVYLDFDGDGLFTGKPYESKTMTGKADYDTYKFSVDINNGFIGYLGWKVEVVRPNGVKTNIQSYATFHAQNGKKDIRVLQIYPNDSNCSFYDNISDKPGTGNTKLTDNSQFMSMLAGLADYNVTIDNITAKDFSSQYGKTKTLKDNYDMVIVGFSDSYSDADIDTDTALADLDAFIADGKSVMFTHDTIGLGILGESSGPTKFAQHYKDYIGQSRYKDYFRNGNESNLYTNKYDDGTSANTTIPHDNTGGKKTLGQTALAASGDSNTYLSTQSKQVKNINDAQITTYPFDLRDYDPQGGTLDVGLTHTQWFQLNLEDPDIVPWYNLVSNKTVANKFNGHIDSGDSRNFYYTYSKGNITYSGTAHSGVATGEQELKLFVNTIIKAVRGSNTAPEVKNYSDSDYSNKIADGATINEKINTEKDYTFYTIPEDVDGDKVTIKATANGTVLDNSAIQIAETGETYDGGRINSATKLKITIPASVYKTVAKGAEIPVEVSATDPLKKEGKSSFKLLSDGNQAPDITNMKNNTSIDNNQEVNAPRTADFTFTTIPTDPDKEDDGKLSVSVKVDGQEILKKDEVASGSKLDVTISEDLLAGKQTGDKVTVETTVNDNHVAANEPNGKSATKKFTLVIDAENPCVNLSLVDSVDENGVFKEVANDKTFEDLDIVKLAGRVSSVYDNVGTIGLEIPKYEVVQGDVTVRRLVNGKLSDTTWKMTKDNSNIGPNINDYYKLDLGAVNPVSLGAVDKGGMQFIVEYSVQIVDTDNVNERINSAKANIGAPKVVTTYEPDGTKVVTTTTITSPEWEYKPAPYVNTLMFNDKKSSANVQLYMSNDEITDTKDDKTPPPPVKHYGFPNLF